jgi:hypothetical protein
MNRFEHLIRHINEYITDHNGQSGQWIKAVKHSELYNTENPNHNDETGFVWFNEVNDRRDLGDIVIFSLNGRNWFVLPQYRVQFENAYPNAELSLARIF